MSLPSTDPSGRSAPRGETSTPTPAVPQPGVDRWQFAVEGSDLGVWDWNMVTDEVYFSPRWATMLGFDPAELSTRLGEWSDRVHPDDLAPTLAQVRAHIEGRAPLYASEHRMRAKDGTYRWILDRGQIVSRGPDGRPLRMVGTHTDVTERRQTEEALRASESNLARAQRIAHLGSWEHTLATGELRWSDEVYRIFGLPRTEAAPTYEAFLAAVHPEDRERLAAASRAAVNGEAPLDLEHRIVRPDATERWVHEVAQLECDAAGRPVRLTGTVHDVTARVLAASEAARASRALAMLSRANAAMIRAESETALLTEICQIAVEVGGFRFAWVGYAEQDPGCMISPQACAGREDGYLAAIRLSWSASDPTGHGPAGRAIRSGETIVLSDIGTNTAGFYWHEAAAARGYRGVVCLPLRQPGRTFGVLALYLAEVRSIPPEELKLLQELAGNLAFGLVSLQARLDRQRTHEAVLTMARGLSAAAGADFFPELALRLVEALGAHAGVVARASTEAAGDLRTLAFVADGRTLPSIGLPREGAPWSDLESQGVRTVPQDVANLYPLTGLFAELRADAYVGTTLFDPAGRPSGVMFVLFRGPLEHPDFIVSTIRIFAARAAAELERQNADARTRELAAMLDKAQDAILVRDLEHRITYWNKSAERLYGWTAAEAVGRSVRLLLYAHPAGFDDAMAALLAHGEWVGELTQRNKAGRPLTIEGRWTLVRDETGAPRSVLAINTDITQRKALEQQFLRAQRLESIGTLAGGIAHDLNNLLSPIIMGVDLLQQYDLPDECRDVIQNIRRSARRGSDLVKQVLSFARGVEGVRVAVLLGPLVREIESIVLNTFPKNLQFEADLPRDLWPVNGDPTQLNQVLLNLCVNARDAMPGGGRLSLRARNVELDQTYAAMHRGVTPGRYVRIDLADTGCGIPPEVLDRIFEPFFTTKELGKGTGLGLSTALGIVRSHGGTITVASEPGHGTTFTLHLPSSAEPSAAEHGGPAAADRLPRGHGEWVLVVDDEESVRTITRQTLEAFGYRTLLAEDGAQAVAVYADHRHDIAAVLTDMMMPVMDGPALIAALRRIDPHLPIIAASGLEANGSSLRTLPAGIRHFLPKPYTAESMLTALHDALRQRPAPA